jgi:hypothetical protein
MQDYQMYRHSRQGFFNLITGISNSRPWLLGEINDWFPQEPCVSSPLLDKSLTIKDLYKLRHLNTEIRTRVQQYGIGWLIRNGEYLWLPTGLHLFAQNNCAGRLWSECGLVSDLVADALWRNNLPAWNIDIVLGQNFYRRPLDTATLKPASMRIPQPEPTSIRHGFVVTRSGYVIDPTDLNHFSKACAAYIPIEKHPFERTIRSVLSRGNLQPVKPMQWQFGAGVCFPYFSYSDYRGTLEYCIHCLPLAVEVLDENRLIASFLGFGFRKDSPEGLKLSFVLLTDYNVLNRSRQVYEIVQSCRLEARIPVLEWPKYQKEASVLSRTDESAGMLEFFQHRIVDKGFGGSELTSCLEIFPGVPNELIKVSYRAVIDFKLWFMFMSKIPHITPKLLDNLAVSSAISVTKPIARYLPREYSRRFPRGSKWCAGTTGGEFTRLLQYTVC